MSPNATSMSSSTITSTSAECHWFEKLSYRPNDKDADPFSLENQSIIFCLKPTNLTNSATTTSTSSSTPFQPSDLWLSFPLLYKVLGTGTKLYFKSALAFETVQANYTSLKIAFSMVLFEFRFLFWFWFRSSFFVLGFGVCVIGLSVFLRSLFTL
jgi:hypothetical protein